MARFDDRFFDKMQEYFRHPSRNTSIILYRAAHPASYFIEEFWEFVRSSVFTIAQFKNSEVYTYRPEIKRIVDEANKMLRGLDK